MKKFKDLGITPVTKIFTGEKIPMLEIINREIVVCDYKIEDSKYAKIGDGKCLHMQIIIDEVKRVVFTGSVVLMDLIQKVPENELPFITTIVKQNKRFVFT